MIERTVHDQAKAWAVTAVGQLKETGLAVELYRTEQLLQQGSWLAAEMGHSCMPESIKMQAQASLNRIYVE